MTLHRAQQNHRLSGLLIISIITFAASTTPIAIRYAQDTGVPSLAIVFMRLVISWVLMTPFVWARHSDTLRSLSKQDYAWGMVAGFWLALNLLALFYALEYTSVLVTGILRRTTPIWIILPEILLLGAIFTWRTWIGSAISLVGVVAVTLGAGSAANAGSDPLLGAALALAGSLFIGIYLLIGRKLSRKMPSVLYSWIVFICASLATGLFMLVTRTPITGYSAEGYLWVLVVTILAQYLGHISINLGLKRFSATMMSIILELSVVLGAVIAFFQFAEVPTNVQIMGSAFIIAGVVLSSQDSS